MSAPALNTSPEAVALREAAFAFARCGEPRGDRDRAGERANAALLSAALRYARAYYKQARDLGLIPSHPAGALLPGGEE